MVSSGAHRARNENIVSPDTIAPYHDTFVMRSRLLEQLRGQGNRRRAR